MNYLSILLNWRIWLCVALAVVGWNLHHAGYEKGKNEVEVQFTLFKNQQLESALAEQVKRDAEWKRLNDENQKVSQDYESLKTATATAVRSLDADRMRLQATLAAYRRATNSDPAAPKRIDEDAAIGVLSECIDRYGSVAATADSQADTLKALQEYVRNVVPK